MSKTDVDPETGEILPAADTDTELEAYRHHLETLQPEDPEAIQERILRQILKATTAEDIINAGAAVNTDKVLDMPMTVLSIRAGESTFKDGPDRFLIVDAIILSNGDKVTFSTSASDVVMKLTALDMRHMLPCDIRLSRATKPTAAGYYPVFLRTIEEAF